MKGAVHHRRFRRAVIGQIETVGLGSEEGGELVDCRLGHADRPSGEGLELGEATQTVGLFLGLALLLLGQERVVLGLLLLLLGGDGVLLGGDGVLFGFLFLELSGDGLLFGFLLLP